MRRNEKITLVEKDKIIFSDKDISKIFPKLYKELVSKILAPCNHIEDPILNATEKYKTILVSIQ